MTLSPDQPIVVPADVPGSWQAMLAICDRRESSNDFFVWENEEDFHRQKALKSKGMAHLIRNLSQLPIRHSFRIGSGLHGVGLMLPYDETRKLWDSRMVALHVTSDRKIEIALLDVSACRLTCPILDQVVCDLEAAPQRVTEFTKGLPGTKITAPNT